MQPSSLVVHPFSYFLANFQSKQITKIQILQRPLARPLSYALVGKFLSPVPSDIFFQILALYHSPILLRFLNILVQSIILQKNLVTFSLLMNLEGRDTLPLLHFFNLTVRHEHFASLPFLVHQSRVHVLDQIVVPITSRKSLPPQKCSYRAE